MFEAPNRVNDQHIWQMVLLPRKMGRLELLCLAVLTTDECTAFSGWLWEKKYIFSPQPGQCDLGKLFLFSAFPQSCSHGTAIRCPAPYESLTYTS